MMELLGRYSITPFIRVSGGQIAALKLKIDLNRVTSIIDNDFVTLFTSISNSAI